MAGQGFVSTPAIYLASNAMCIKTESVEKVEVLNQSEKRLHPKDRGCLLLAVLSIMIRAIVVLLQQ